jgi:hypothetical protein
MGLEVILLGPKALAAFDALDAVELGRPTQLQGGEDLDRNVARPAPHLAQVLAVEKDSGEKGILCDLLGGVRCHRSEAGNLHISPDRTSFQPRLATSCETSTTSSGRRARLAAAPASIPA